MQRDYATMDWFEAHQMLNRACLHLAQQWVVGNHENVDSRNLIIAAMIAISDSQKVAA